MRLGLVKEAIEFIETNLLENLSVAEVCAQVSLSPWEFQRLFRLTTGNSIGEYLRGRRLSLAADELVSVPSVRLLDLAIKYQFGSQEAFTRSFKRYFGLTPGEAREQARESKMQLRLKQKAKLTQNQLEHNLEGISREPEILTLPTRCYAGVRIEIASPFSEDDSYIEDVSNLWLKFNPLRKSIESRVQGVAYGLVLSPGGKMMEDRFPYAAAVEITQMNHRLTEDIERIEIPSQQYACFEKRGLADKTKMSIDYIYGFWLPQSDFVRAEGYDIEVFDHRLRLDEPESVSRYCVPIRLKI